MEENRETILDELTSFEKRTPKEITPVLDEYLLRIAKTGDTMFPWNKLKPLFLHKMEKVISEFYETCPSEDPASCPNVEKFCFDSMKEKLLEAIENFSSSAPFTIQRLCELITTPRKHYKRTDKFLRGLEKNVLVVSTVEPGCSHIFACDCSNKRHERDSIPLVNGIVDPPASINGMNDFTSFSSKGSTISPPDFIPLYTESDHETEDSKPFNDIEKDNSVDDDKDVNMDTSSSVGIEEEPAESNSTSYQETPEVKQEAAATSSDDSVSSSLPSEQEPPEVDSPDHHITNNKEVVNGSMSPEHSDQNNPDSNTESESNNSDASKDIEEPSEDVVSTKEESPPDSSTEKMEEKTCENVSSLEQDNVCDTTPSEEPEKVLESDIEIKDSDNVGSPSSDEITTTSSSSQEITQQDDCDSEQSDKIPDSSEAEECNTSDITDIEDKPDTELSKNIVEEEENKAAEEPIQNEVEPMEED